MMDSSTIVDRQWLSSAMDEVDTSLWRNAVSRS